MRLCPTLNSVTPILEARTQVTAYLSSLFLPSDMLEVGLAAASFGWVTECCFIWNTRMSFWSIWCLQKSASYFLQTYHQVALVFDRNLLAQSHNINFPFVAGYWLPSIPVCSLSYFHSYLFMKKKTNFWSIDFLHLLQHITSMHLDRYCVSNWTQVFIWSCFTLLHFHVSSLAHTATFTLLALVCFYKGVSTEFTRYPAFVTIEMLDHISIQNVWQDLGLSALGDMLD